MLPFKKGVASALVFFMLVSHFEGHVMAGNTSVSPSPLTDQANLPLPSFPIKLSPELGTIEESRPGSSKIIVHIQAAHGHLESQRKIQAILQTLKDDYGFNDLLLEGATHALHPELLNFIPKDHVRNKKILETLLEKGLAKGTDLFLSENAGLQTFGLEEPKVYRDNLRLLREIGRAHV